LAAARLQVQKLFFPSGRETDPARVAGGTVSCSAQQQKNAILFFERNFIEALRFNRG
jgi:hypothetical protein